MHFSGKSETSIFDDIQTIRVAAQSVGYSYSHVRLLADTGRIEAVKRGRLWLVYIPSLKAYAKRKNRLKSSD